MVVIGVLVATGGAFGLWRMLRPAGAAALGKTATVTRGELLVSVTEAGELESEKRTIIRNDLRWPVFIKTVVPNGTRVAKDNVIIEFECREVTEAMEKVDSEIIDAIAEYEESQENLNLMEEEMPIRVGRAEQAISDAEKDLLRYREGEWPTKKGEAESAIQMAKRDLALAEDKLNFKLKANKDPELNSPYSENEIEADRLSVDRLKVKLEKARSEHEMLVKYDHPRALRLLEAAVSDSRVNFRRAKLEAARELRKSRVQRDSRKEKLDNLRTRMKELEEETSKLKVLATSAGLVVYDTGWRSELEVEPGEKVNPRQKLMKIPDMETLQVGTRVYEAVIDQVTAKIEPDNGDGAGLRRGRTRPASQPSTAPATRAARRPATAERPNPATTLAATTSGTSQPTTANKPHRQPTRALITVDAKGATFPGYVLKKDVLPSRQHRWLNPDVKIYSVVVAFDEEIPGLKPGMTAKVELILDRLEEVLSVPVAAVFTERGETFCYRVTDGKPVRVAVETGKMNPKRVEITSGLLEGDRVLLAAPAGESRTETESERVGGPRGDEAR